MRSSVRGARIRTQQLLWSTVSGKDETLLIAGTEPGRDHPSAKPRRSASSPALKSPKSPTKAAQAPPAPQAAASSSKPLLPGDMQCLLSIVEGMDSVIALKRGGRCKHVMFRGDKEGVESAAKRSFKVRLLSHVTHRSCDLMASGCTCAPPACVLWQAEA
jgi:hypothetical protein